MLIRLVIAAALSLILGTNINAQESKKKDAQKETDAKKAQDKDGPKKDEKEKGDNKKKPKALSEEDRAKVISTLRKVQTLLQSDSDEAIKLSNKLLEDYPTLRPALFFKANALHFKAYQLITEEKKQKEGYAIFVECAATMRKLAKYYPKLNPSESQFMGTVLYNEACAHSLSGKKKEAVKSLADATKAGFKDISHIEKDEDLKSIREMPEYKKLIEELKKEKKAKDKDKFDF